MYSAVGVHVFAGGYSGGVADVMEVKAQLESHSLGNETSEKVWGVPTINCDARDWPRVDADMAFANPRCTGFSLVTAGYGASAHGPDAKQCQDIHDFIDYSAGHYKAIVWESVQQAYTTGKPLLDRIRDRLVPMGYRVCHVLCNAATFGNAQQRKRYFFVAHPRELPFNVDVPAISPYYSVMYDAIWHLRDRDTVEWHPRSCDHHENCVVELTDEEKHSVSRVPTGWSLNQVGMYDYDALHPRFKQIWTDRTSNMPFSMHTIYRSSWLRPAPTLTGSAGRILHPWHDRPLSILELATIMGWRGKVPLGKNPIGQIAKGVVPDVGAWITQQVVKCLNDEWGGESWSTRFDHRTAEFLGEDTRDADEKTIDITRYCGHQFDIERYPEEARQQFKRFNVDPLSGRLIRRWEDINVV